MNINEIKEYYNTEVEKLAALKESDGEGAVRGATGRLYQDIAELLILSVDPSLKCKHNDFLIKYSKSGKYKVKNIQVDLHVYREDTMLFILESKTYLDSCYLKRSIADFREVREIVGDVPAILWSGQNAVSDETFGFWNEECDFETFYCNSTKKRVATLPTYKTCDPLDIVVLEKFVKYVRSII